MKQKLHEYLFKLNLLNANEIEHSLSLFEEFKLKKDHYFIVEQEICDKVAFIASGGLRAFSTNPDGNENITCFKFENQFVTSYESLALQQPSKKNIQAIENCHLLVIDFSKLNQLTEAVPSWKFISNLIMEQEFMNKEDYLLNLNNKSAKEKYLHVITQSPEIVKRVQTSHLASYLGITPRTLTRVKREILQPAL
ncbi:Transcriptional activator protein Anr [compost metagenome]